ncbi:hypothetical protein [Acinetobacter wuhouensis]|uniref:Uncharacterized protein n=1 Tax=Acinetobacter wuhouensis TaxID=1879050 RepID=A0A3G2T1S8_9GAMM|nr:hypothetical protein [Acinetobacter wuhouensis]AYO54179.1 hypothetical protein CDG68_11260 [Acinetobacter wuhouensis]
MGTAVATQHILQAVDWKKYTVEQWFIQFGAWIESNRMSAGSLPDDLGVNQIWLLMRSTGAIKIPSGKITVPCRIEDYEARAFQRLLIDTMDGAEPYFKLGIICLYKNLVEGKGVRTVGEETNQSKSQAATMASIGKSYICGRHSYLKVGLA